MGMEPLAFQPLPYPADGREGLADPRGRPVCLEIFMTEANIAGGLLGGAMIGAASVLLLLLIGRIAGISGIVGGAFIIASVKDVAWRVAFIAGLILGAALYQLSWGPCPSSCRRRGAY